MKWSNLSWSLTKQGVRTREKFCGKIQQQNSGDRCCELRKESWGNAKEILEREAVFAWVSQSFYRWQHSWLAQTITLHDGLVWQDLSINLSVGQFLTRFTSCKVWRFRIVYPLQIRAFRIRTVLQDSADLPRLALLLVLQAHGQPSAGKLTEMKREKGQKMDWAVKLALHSLVVSRCYLGSTYILRFVTFIFIIFQSFSYLFQCCTVRNRLEISANQGIAKHDDLDSRLHKVCMLYASVCYIMIQWCTVG